MTGEPTAYFCDRAWLGSEVGERVMITVEAGKITSVEADTVDAGANAVRLPGLTVPGFANAHSHSFHRALRGRTHRGRDSFWTWRDLMYEVAGRLTPDSYRRLARAVFAEMVMAGYTVVGEFHYVHHNPDGTPYADPNEMGTAIVEAAAEAGIRLTLLNTAYLHGGLGADGYRNLEPHQRRFSDETADRFLHRGADFPSRDNVIHGLAIHSVRAVDPESIALIADAAGDRPLHTHVSEQQAENDQSLAAHEVSPTELLAAASALSTRFTAVHATHLTRRDISLLGEAGATVCMCPTTERDLADGIGPTGDLAAASVPLAIGSDSHAIVDPFVECRAIELDERLATGRRGTHSPEALLTAGTAAGYRSLGWDSGGSIAVGALADFTTINTDSVRVAGTADADPISAVVFAASSADVTDVVVGGRHVVTGGAHRSIDVSAELTATIGAVT